MKQCIKCKQWKAKSCFSPSKEGKYGLQSRCKKCRNIEQKIKRGTQEGKRAFRKSVLKCKYNVALKQYNKMFEEQKGVCAVCRKPETAQVGKTIRCLCVDHNHKTGKIRGLLCRNCNVVLGVVKEDKERLLQLALYLEQHNG